MMRRDNRNGNLPIDSMKKTAYVFNEQDSEKYRNADERIIHQNPFLHYRNIIQDISSSFNHKITVLDLGCGTGRYFHCLKNVEKLVGIDTSPHMLKKAHNPVNKEFIEIEKIELLCGDIFDIQIPDLHFDFIYAIGVFGEFSPLSQALCSRLYELLKPYGILFLTTVDVHSRIQYLDESNPYWQKLLLGKFFWLFPKKLKKYINKKLGAYYITKEELENIWIASAFPKFEISLYKHPKGLGWEGIHHDCTAVKESLQK